MIYRRGGWVNRVLVCVVRFQLWLFLYGLKNSIHRSLNSESKFNSVRSNKFGFLWFDWNKSESINTINFKSNELRNLNSFPIMMTVAKMGRSGDIRWVRDDRLAQFAMGISSEGKRVGRGGDQSLRKHSRYFAYVFFLSPFLLELLENNNRGFLRVFDFWIINTYFFNFELIILK